MFLLADPVDADDGEDEVEHEEAGVGEHDDEEGGLVEGVEGAVGDPGVEGDWVRGEVLAKEARRRRRVQRESRASRKSLRFIRFELGIEYQ